MQKWCNKLWRLVQVRNKIVGKILKRWSLESLQKHFEKKYCFSSKSQKNTINVTPRPTGNRPRIAVAVELQRLYATNLNHYIVSLMHCRQELCTKQILLIFRRPEKKEKSNTCSSVFCQNLYNEKLQNRNANEGDQVLVKNTRTPKKTFLFVFVQKKVQRYWER